MIYPIGKPPPCSSPARSHKLLTDNRHRSCTGVPLLYFVVMYKYRIQIDQLVVRLKQYDAENDTFTSVREHTVIALAHGAPDESGNAPQHRNGLGKRQSFVTQATDLLWLSNKIDMFEPNRCWCTAYSIGLRIVQTSVMVFFTSASLRAAVASLISLTGVCVQMNARPYRRPSE